MDLLSTIEPPKNEMDQNSVVHILFIFLTGTNASPQTEDVKVVASHCAAIVFLVCIVSVLILLQAFMKELYHPRLLKTLLIIWYYIIPMCLPFLLSAFSRYYAYVPIGICPVSFIFVLFSNLLVLVILMLITLISSISAYPIKHIFAASYPIQGLILHILLVFSSQVISYTEYQSFFLLIVVNIMLFATIIYVNVEPPFVSPVMTLIILIYYIFSFLSSIIRLSNNLHGFNLCVLMFIISIFVSAIIFYGIRPMILCKSSVYSQTVYQLSQSCSKESINIFGKLKFDILSAKQLRSLGRFNEKLDDSALLFLLNLLKKRRIKEAEEHIFIHTLESIVKARSGDFDQLNYKIIEEYIKEYEFLNRKFWESVLMSDFTPLAKLSARIGRKRLLIKENLEEAQKHFPDAHIYSETIPRICKNESKIKKKSCCPISVFIIVFLALLTLAGHFYMVAIFFSNDQINQDFYLTKNFTEQVSLMQTELWPLEDINLGENYYEAVKQWKILQDRSSMQNLINQIDVILSIPYKALINNYFDSVLEINRTKQMDDNFTKNHISLFFDYAYSGDIVFFNSFFEEDSLHLVDVIEYTGLILMILFILFFFHIIYYKSAEQHKFFEQFRFLSKHKILEFAQLHESDEIIIPSQPSPIELSALRNTIYSFIILVLTLFVLFSILGIAFALMKKDYTYIQSSNIFFAHANLALLYLSTGELLSFYPNTSQSVLTSMIFADKFFSKNVYSKVDKYSIPPEVDIIIGSHLTGINQHEEDKIDSKATIQKLYTNIHNADVPYGLIKLKYFTRIFWFVALSLVLVIFAIVSLNYLNSIIFAESQNGQLMLSEYIDFFNEIQSCQSKEKTIFNPVDLPIIFFECDQNMNISYLTSKASEILNVKIGDNLMKGKLSLIQKADLMSTLQPMINCESLESVVIQKEPGEEALVSPSFIILHNKITLDSFTVIDNILKQVQMPSQHIISQYFPCCSDFAEYTQYKAGEICLLYVKLNKLHEWCNSTAPQIVQQYYKSVITELDQDETFSRVNIQGDIILYKMDFKQSTNRWSFINFCAIFGKKACNTIHMLSQQYDSPIEASVIFIRCDQPSLVEFIKTNCSQPDLITETGNQITECFQHFQINGIGFATPQKQNMRIPNMAKMLSFKLNEGNITDLYILI